MAAHLCIEKITDILGRLLEKIRPDQCNEMIKRIVKTIKDKNKELYKCLVKHITKESKSEETTTCGNQTDMEGYSLLEKSKTTPLYSGPEFSTFYQANNSKPNDPGKDTEKNERSHMGSSHDLKMMNSAAIGARKNSVIESYECIITEKSLPNSEKYYESQNTSIRKEVKSTAIVSYSDQVASWRQCNQSAHLRHVESRSQGLKNNNNTCFMNSILQCIAHFDSFLSLVTQIPGRSKFTVSFKCLIKKLRTKEHVSDILQYFSHYSAKDGGYGDGSQKDSKEFYNFIISTLEEEISSELLESTCLVKKIETFEFNSCGHSNPTPNITAFIPLQGSSRWEYDLQEYVSSEKVLGNFYCAQCETYCRGYRTTEVKFPKVLVIYFHQQIEFKLGSETTLKEEYYSCDSQRNVVETWHRYRAEAIISRSGFSRDYGHYWTTALEDSNIFQYNDANVSALTSGLCQAYLIFFNKIS